MPTGSLIFLHIWTGDLGQSTPIKTPSTKLAVDLAHKRFDLYGPD